MRLGHLLVLIFVKCINSYGYYARTVKICIATVQCQHVFENFELLERKSRRAVKSDDANQRKMRRMGLLNAVTN